MIKNCEVCQKELVGRQKRTCSRKCSRKLSSGFTGKKHSLENLKKMSEARLRNPNRYWLGKKKSIEVINLIKEGIKKSNNWQRNEKHWAWKENPSYVAIHQWMTRHYGQPQKCDFCLTTKAKRFHWANISGEYKRIRSDWYRLCQSCHIDFDDTIRRGWKTRKENITYNN